VYVPPEAEQLIDGTYVFPPPPFTKVGEEK
jgi:hypothetical protein